MSILKVVFLYSENKLMSTEVRVENLSYYFPYIDPVDRIGFEEAIKTMLFDHGKDYD